MNKIIGTGGIGTGIFYRLEDNRDIGRDESRPAHRLDQRDFCKQHIILHYLPVLLRDLKRTADVIPIGAVGKDSAGTEVLREMENAGLKIDHVQRLTGASTMCSICYLFPDGSGGNFTESHSACEKVSPPFIARAWSKIRPARGEAMVLAAPEVPLVSRRKLLKLGRLAQSFNVASFVSQEMARVRKEKILRDVDLLSLNLDEGAALAEVSTKLPVVKVAEAVQRVAQKFNPMIQIVVTAGVHGVYGFDQEQGMFLPRLNLKPVNTAGAGDAFLSGVMLGKILGLPFISPDGPACLHLGRALAAMKVLSPHTINFDINLKSLRAFLRRHGEQIL